MIFNKINTRTSIRENNLEFGEPIERKLERLINNNEPIGESLDPIYMERKDGVLAEYNIRTDRFEIAVEAMDKVSKSRIAKREERGKVVEMKASEGGSPDASNMETK